MAKKLWKLLVIPVVVGVLVVAFTDVEVFSMLGRGIKAVGKFFLDPVSIPLWLVILLLIAGVGGVLVLGWAWFIVWRDEVDVPEHYSFTKLRFLGVDWEWTWYAGDIGNPLMLCPSCKNQLDFKEEFHSVEARTECENCGAVERLGARGEEVSKRVYKEIHRLVRTGEYKKTIHPSIQSHAERSEDVGHQGGGIV